MKEYEVVMVDTNVIVTKWLKKYYLDMPKFPGDKSKKGISKI